MVAGGGFEPPKLSRQIYSLIPLAARESRRIVKLYSFTSPSFTSETNESGHLAYKNPVPYCPKPPKIDFLLHKNDKMP